MSEIKAGSKVIFKGVKIYSEWAGDLTVGKSYKVKVKKDELCIKDDIGEKVILLNYRHRYFEVVDSVREILKDLKKENASLKEQIETLRGDYTKDIGALQDLFQEKIQALEKVIVEKTKLRESVKEIEFKGAICSDSGRTPETVDVYEPIESTPKKTPNQQRAEIIEKAKAFVEDVTKRMASINPNVEGNITFRDCTTKPEFHINSKKRTVIALVKGLYGVDCIYEKGIAKCAPDDVYNEYIGKAIALGRALGLDVKRFEQAVQPTELVVGMKTNRGEVKAVRPTHRESTGERYSGYERGYTVCNKDETWYPISWAEILDDTNAVYTEEAQ